MINTNIKFEEDSLTITFTEASIETKIIEISIKDDVDFKELIDFLVHLVPHEKELQLEFEGDNILDKKEKLDLIKETTTEILEHFNNSIKHLRKVENIPVVEAASKIPDQKSDVKVNEVEDENLPF